MPDYTGRVILTDEASATMDKLKAASQQASEAVQQLTTSGKSFDDLVSRLVGDVQKGTVSIEALQKEGYDLTSVMDALSAATEKADAAAAQSEGSLQKEAAGLQQVAAAAEQSVPALQNASAAKEKMGTSAGNASGALMGLQQVAGELPGPLGTLVSSGSQAAMMLESLGPAAAAGVAVAGLLAIENELLKAAGAAIQADQQWQLALVHLQADTGMTQQEVQQTAQGVLEVAANTGLATDKLLVASRQISDFGFKGAEGLQVLNVAAQTAVADGGQVDKIGQSIASTLHQYGVSAEDAAKYVNVLAIAAQNGNETIDGFAQASQRALAIAAKLGVPLDQATAALTALTLNGFNASEAQTQLVGALTHIIKPSQQAETELMAMDKALLQAGVSSISLTSDFSAAGLQSKGLSGVLNDLQTAYSKLGLSQEEVKGKMKDLFTPTQADAQAMQDLGMSQAEATDTTMKLLNAQRGGLGVAVLLSNGQKDYKNMLSETSKALSGDATPMQDAFNNAMEQGGQKAAVIDQRFKEMQMAIGQGLRPEWEGLEKSILDATGSLDGSKQSMDGVAQSTSNLVTNVANIVTSFPQVQQAINEVTSALELLGGSSNSAASVVSDSANTMKEAMIDTSQQTGQSLSEVQNAYVEMADKAEDRSHAAAQSTADNLKLTDAQNNTQTAMDNILKAMDIAIQAGSAGNNDGVAFMNKLLAAVQSGMGPLAGLLNNIIKMFNQVIAAKNAALGGSGSYDPSVQNDALHRNDAMLAGQQYTQEQQSITLPSQQSRTGLGSAGYDQTDAGIKHAEALAKQAAAHDKAAQSAAKHGAAEAKAAEQAKDAADKAMQSVANHEALARAKDQVTQAQAALTDATERYKIILGSVDDQIKSVKAEEQQRLSGLQGQIDPLKAQLSTMQMASQAALQGIDNQIKQAEGVLKEYEATARQALDPFIAKVKEATAALAAMQHVGQMMDDSFRQGLEGIQEQLYELDQQFQGPIRALTAMSQSIQDQITQVQRAEEQALFPMDEAIRQRQQALQTEQQNVQDLTDHYDDLLKPLQAQLAALNQINQAQQRQQELDKLALEQRNLQEQLQRAPVGSREWVLAQAQLQQVNSDIANKQKQFGLEDQIAQIQQEKTTALDAANERLKAHERELQALQREREEVAHRYELELRNLNLEKQAIDDQLQAQQRAYDARRQQLEDEQRAMQHSQTLFDQQQRQREAAAQQNVDDANRELTAQKAVWDQELAQQQALIAGLQAIKQQRQDEDAAAQQALSSRIAFLQGVYTQVEGQYTSELTQLDGIKTHWENTQTAAENYAKSIVDKAQGIYNTLNDHIQQTDAAATKTDALEKYTTAYGVSIGQAQAALQTMTPQVANLNTQGFQPVQKMLDPSITGSLGNLMQNWDPNNENGYRKQISTSIHDVGNSMAAYLPIQEDKWKAYFSLVGGGIQDLMTKLSAYATAVQNLPTPPSGSPPGTPPGVPQMARGGVVTKPTLALIGEGGPEAVVPLDGNTSQPLGAAGGYGTSGGYGQYFYGPVLTNPVYNIAIQVPQGYNLPTTPSGWDPYISSLSQALVRRQVVRGTIR